MHPILFKVGGLVVSTYGFMMVCVFVAGLWITYLEFKRKGLDTKRLEAFLAAAIIGGMVGGKIMYVIENVAFSKFMESPFSYLGARGGLTYYGGFILAVALIWMITKIVKMRFLVFADAAAPATALGYCLARVGCLLVGDDYGVASDLPWAMAFPQGSPPIDIKVHPTQIYEIIMMFAVFLGLWKLRKRDKPDGWIFGWLLALGGLERFLVEFVRVTTSSPIPHISVAQLISVALMALGAYFIFRKGDRKELS